MSIQVVLICTLYILSSRLNECFAGNLLSSGSSDRSGKLSPQQLTKVESERESTQRTRKSFFQKLPPDIFNAINEFTEPETFTALSKVHPAASGETEILVQWLLQLSDFQEFLQVYFVNFLFWNRVIGSQKVADAIVRKSNAFSEQDKIRILSDLLLKYPEHVILIERISNACLNTDSDQPHSSDISLDYYASEETGETIDTRERLITGNPLPWVKNILTGHYHIQNLYAPVRQGDTLMCQLLLNKGYSPNANNPLVSYITSAVTQQHGDIVSLLISKGADVNGINDPPIVEASAMCLPDMARLLIENGANVYVRSRTGMSAMDWMDQWAISRPACMEVLEILVSGGYDLTRVTRDGASPLHRAVLMGNVPLVKRLLELGASPTAKDYKGKTPDQYTKDPEMSAIILQAREA